MIHKIHTILPKSFTVQLITVNDKKIKTENILCHLNIYFNKNGCYTYSFIPTNPDGLVSLTKEEILNNIELRHSFDKTLPLDKTPVKFEFLILSKEFLSTMINSIDRYLSVSIESALEGLRSRGLAEEQILKAKPEIIRKMEEDKTLRTFLLKNKNYTLEFDEEKSKITDIWTDEIDYKYELKIQL